MRDKPQSRRSVLTGAAAAVFAQTGCAAAKDRDELSVFKTSAAKARYLALYEAALSRWPAPYETLRLPTRFGRTHVIANGPAGAPPLVLLHALMTSALVWRPNVAELSRLFRTYAVDLIGEANRSEPVRPLRDRRDCADWLTDVFDGLGIERAHVVGNSLGGFLALNQVTLVPERIERVVLISPVGIAPLSWRLLAYGGLAMTFGIRGPMDAALGGGVPWDPANNAWAAVNAAGQAGGRNLNARGFGDFSEAELQAIRAPALLLVGDREAVYRDRPDEVVAMARKLMPKLQAEIVPGANHLAALARPQEVNSKIIRFLNRL